MQAKFTLHLEILDEEALRLAAEQRALKDGLTLEEWREVRSGVNSDLVMMLDPGTLAGCQINETETDFIL